MKFKDEALALAVTLQNVAEPYDARKAACDALLAASRSESSCTILCSAGAIHSVFVAIKTPGEPPALLRSALALLCNLNKFDSKLVSVVARLQVLRLAHWQALLPFHLVGTTGLRRAAPSDRARDLAHPPHSLRAGWPACSTPSASISRCPARTQRSSAHCCTRSATSAPRRRTPSSWPGRTGRPCCWAACSRT